MSPGLILSGWGDPFVGGIFILVCACSGGDLPECGCFVFCGPVTWGSKVSVWILMDSSRVEVLWGEAAVSFIVGDGSGSVRGIFVHGEFILECS